MYNFIYKGCDKKMELFYRNKKDILKFYRNVRYKFFKIIWRAFEEEISQEELGLKK